MVCLACIRCKMIIKVLTLSFVVCLASGFEDKTVTQYLADNGYTTLVTALHTSGLASTLDGSGPYTFFAPSNAAFQGVNISAYTREQLATILRYHVIKEFVLVPMIKQASNKTTLEGQNLMIEPSGGSLLLNGNARVDASHNDIIVNNGVVQPVDKLLSPPVFINDNLFQVILKDGSRFQDLTLALLLADLISTLEGSEFTLFAPIDAAFAVYKDNLLNPASPDAGRVYQEILKYHFVPGGRRSNQLHNGQQLYTLHGTPINVTIGSGVLVNNANVIQADILASNGVVHAIDRLLIPQDISQIVAGRK